MRGLDHFFQLRFRHSRLQRAVGSFVRHQRDFRSEAHQFHFVIALYHSATGCDRGSAGDVQLRRSFSDTLAENEAHCFFDTDGASAQAVITEPLCDLLVWAFVLLPYANVGLGDVWTFCDLLDGTSLLKSRTHI